MAALIGQGWIFFRANSPSQARQMLAAIASPGIYGSHFLSSSLYVVMAFWRLDMPCAEVR